MKREVIVVKYGSSGVANRQGMDMAGLRRYAAALVTIYGNYDIIIVSSGSVAAGKYIWHKQKAEQTLADSRTLAMIGSATAFSAWQVALWRYRLIGGQLLVTHREVDDPTEGLSLRAALEGNLRHGIISVVNENDALSDTELAKLSYGGDNDGLAAHIAIIVKASILLLLTDQHGLLAQGQLVKRVAANQKAWEMAKACIRVDISRQGRGGMLSKVHAATQAAKAGIDVHIAAANQSLQDVLIGKAGTHFEAKK